MNIVKARPPNFAEIVKVFPQAATDNILFCYGTTIFNPSGKSVPPEIIAHEQIHVKQQYMIGVDLWWRRYLEDRDFRFDMELPAHKAEFWRLARGVDATRRRDLLKYVAEKMAAPLYGNMITVDDAMRVLIRY